MSAKGIRYAVLGSGSRGNAYIIEGERFSVLVDQGYAPAELRERLAAADFDERHIKYIFLTHTHSDHAKGVADVARYNDAVVITHPKTALLPDVCRWDAGPGKYYQDATGRLGFEAFATLHDAPHSLGYSIDIDFDFRFTIITDTGRTTDDMRSHAAAAHVLFLEANYSPNLLASGSYPAFLKRRIAGDTGHLSNLDAARFLLSLGESVPPRVFLCHLSQDNNNPQTVAAEFAPIFSVPKRCKLTVCPKDTLMPTEELAPFYKKNDFIA